MNDISFHYQLSGDKTKSTVVLSHSLMSDSRMWDPQLPVLEPHFQVLRYDTRGHGKSTVTEGDYSLNMLADDAITLLDHLGLQKVHFVGLSMGGMIGQNLSLRHAKRLHSLSLCDTTARIPEEAQPLWRERIELARWACPWGEPVLVQRFIQSRRR